MKYRPPENRQKETGAARQLPTADVLQPASEKPHPLTKPMNRSFPCKVISRPTARNLTPAQLS